MKDQPNRNLPLDRIDLLEAAINSCKCGVTIACARSPKIPLVYVNPAFEEITGYGSKEALGKSFGFLQGGRANKKARVQIQQALDEKTPLTVVLRKDRRDGTPFWSQLHLSPVETDGKVTHYIGIQNDITVEEENKKALKKSEASLRELNREKERLLGVAAHDLRTPLALVKSLVKLVKEADPAETAEMLSMIEEVVEKARLTVDDILNLEAIQTGVITLNIEQVNLKHFLEQCTRWARATCALKEIRFVCDADQLPSSAQFDPFRIERVLDNLVTNAVKYSHRGTQITLKAKREGERLVFAIQDQGQGIPENEIPWLFDPFSKTSTIPTEGEARSGLGLTIIKRLVALHDGSIAVTSQLGKGSTFSISIPMTHNAAAACD